MFFLLYAVSDFRARRQQQLCSGCYLGSHSVASAPSEEESAAPGERGFDWKDYNYELDADDWGQPLNPLAALFDGIPGFDATRLEGLQHDLPVPDHLDVSGLSMLVAVEMG